MMSKKTNQVFSYYMKPFKKILGKVAPTFFSKEQAALSTLLLSWDQIVGDSFASRCLPQRITFLPNRQGTLHIQTSSACALELSYLSSLILDRVNVYFGYGAVQFLKIHHFPFQQVSKGKDPVSSIELPQETLEQIDACVSTIQDPDLQQILRRIGQGIFQK